MTLPVPQSWRVVAATVAAAVVLIGLAYGLRAYARYDDAQARADDRRELAAQHRVNTVCGSRPVSVDRHGSGWSTGPFWVVHCPDGTVAVVKE